MTYTYERGYNAPGDDPGSYLFRSAMMTAWDLAPTDSKDWTAEEKASARAATKTYREWLRPILKDCVVHHVLPRPDGRRWDGMFYWSEKLRKGTLFVFRPDSPESRESVRLAGLSDTKKYLVWSEDGSVPPGLRTGKELMDTGVSISLTSRYSSDMRRNYRSQMAGERPGRFTSTNRFPRPITLAPPRRFRGHLAAAQTAIGSI
jgi:hypothetical protein